MTRPGRVLAAVVVACVAATGCLSAPADVYEPVDLAALGPSAAPQPELRSASVDRVVRDATVRVRNRMCFGVGSGSGFMLTDQVLATNRHVVAGADELQVSTWDGRSLDVTVNSATDLNDLALVRLAGPLRQRLELGSSPEPGTEVVAVGYPEGREIAFARGTVVDYVDGAEYGQTDDVMRITSELARGNSGGPVVDAEGRVVGVAFAIETDTGHGLVVPVESLLDATEGGEFSEQPSAC